MNIEKADYGTIIKFGTLYDILNKLKIEQSSIQEIIEWKDAKDMSLLEISIVSRKFDVSKFLLDNGAQVNNVSKSGSNEFHYLASNLNCEGAVEIGEILLEKKTSLMQKEIKYGNTAFFSLCIEAFKTRSTSVMKFVEKCFNEVTSVDEPNRNGMTIRKLINERGSDKLKKLLKEKYE